MMHILEGESLLNDASGLGCLRFAIAAALTGTFSFPDAVAGFFGMAIGGVAAGVVVCWAATRAITILGRKLGTDTGSNILTSVLIPFAAYRSEEHTSELQSLMRNSYAAFCLKKKNNHT